MTSSSSSSEGHRLRGKSSMHKLRRLHRHHPPPPPPPPPSPCRCQKHRSLRHHSCLSPPPPPFHGGHHFGALSDHSPPLRCPHQHRHKKDKFRIKPPKPTKKIHKLRRKLMKAAMKLPKCSRHGGHHGHTHFLPPKDGVFSSHISHRHPPGCCLHGMGEEGFSTEEQCPLHDMDTLHNHRRRCHSSQHKTCATRTLIKSEIVRREVAPEDTTMDEAPAELPIQDVAVPLDPSMPHVEEPAPVIPAP